MNPSIIHSRHIIGCFAIAADVTVQELAKLARSNAVNDVGKPNRGFGVDMNEVIIVLRDNSVHYFPLATKREVAEKIVDIAIVGQKQLGVGDTS